MTGRTDRTRRAQHRDLEDLLAAAREFLAEGWVPDGIPLFADGDGKNPFNEAYMSWLFRFWALTMDCERGARVAFKPMPTEESIYDTDELECWLEEDARNL